RGPQQNEKAEKQKRLQDEPEQRWQYRTEPAAEEQRHDQGRDQRDADVLADEKHAELHARVLAMEAREQLVFRLRKVERQAASLGDAGDQEHDETQELGNTEPEPL